MALTFSSNLSGISIAHSLNRHLLNSYKSMQKLSSGFRINSGADGPAELVISEQLRAQIAGLTQKIENAQATIGKYQTASSNISELRSYLTDLQTLAIGAANTGYNDAVAQATYAGTAEQVVEQFNELAATAEYNGHKLFDGSEGALGTISQLEGVDLSSTESIQQSMVAIDEAINNVDQVMANTAAYQNYQLESSVRSMQVTRQNLIASESTIRDTDYLSQFTNFVKESIQTKASLALLAHSRVNAQILLDFMKA